VVKVNGDSGDTGNECIAGVVVKMGGFSFACRAEANARGLGVRTGGVAEGSGCVVVAGGEGGVDGGAAGAAVICCDNFEGGRDPCSRVGCCGTAGALFARGRLEPALSLVT